MTTTIVPANWTSIEPFYCLACDYRFEWLEEVELFGDCKSSDTGLQRLDEYQQDSWHHPEIDVTRAAHLFR